MNKMLFCEFLLRRTVIVNITHYSLEFLNGIFGFDDVIDKFDFILCHGYALSVK